MKFSELLELPYNREGDGRIYYNLLENHLPNTPQDVIEQFYYDHGRNSDFFEQYKNLEISKLKWEIVEVKAIELLDFDCFEDFSDYLENVSNYVDDFKIKNWSSIDLREYVVDYWSKNKTWMRMPIFIEGRLLNKQYKFHLIEGHTRMGILKGLLNHNIIEKDSNHKIWLATL